MASHVARSCVLLRSKVKSPVWLALGLVLLPALSCSSSDSDSSQYKNGNGAGANGSDTGSTYDGGGKPDDLPGQLDANIPPMDGNQVPVNCGEQTEPIELINLGDPPDLLIVLDRSGSMQDWEPFQPPFVKWLIMRDALNKVLTARQASIHFGLSVFPTDDNCRVDPGARVGVSPNNAAPIISYMNTISPNGNTPARDALREALNYYQSIPVNPAGRYVLFATDGMPNCGDDSGIGTVAAVGALANAGIHTFVLGLFNFGAADVLEQAAVAGREPAPGGPPSYYQAGDPASLEQALNFIAGGIIVPSCSYQLASAPPVPEDVTVSIDGVPVPRSPSHANGWDYHPDNSTITFFGSYCDDLKAGRAAKVSFVFGCPGPIVY